MLKVIIIGGGAVGCAVAREISRYECDVMLLEKCNDVSEGTSKANSGIVHAGHDATPGTNKAKFNVLGNAMFDELSSQLDFPFKRNGAFVVCFDENELPSLEKLLEKGEKNGVKGLKIIDGDTVRKIEPNLSQKVAYALYAPSSGIVSPYEMVVAFAENAYDNGVKFQLSCKVDGISKSGDGFVVSCGDKSFYGDVVVNCAGVYADEINDMVNEPSFKITARKGEYMLLDKYCGDIVSHTIFQLPTSMGKGVLVTQTTHGNILVGPTSVDIEDKDDVETTREGLETLWNKGIESVPTLDRKQRITQFAGNRAHGDVGDFVVGWAQKGFFNVACIESPGLTSAPALGVHVAAEISSLYGLKANKNFNPIRKDIPHLALMTEEERNKLIAENPEYGKIVCRCEVVSEGEIRASIKRPLGARSFDGVKRRTRAGMGRCQSGFCCPEIVKILSEELGISEEEVLKDDNVATMLFGRTK